MALSLASLFSSEVIAAQFDIQCEAQAAQGRTYGPLLTMLDSGYGLEIPAGTAAAIKYLNLNLFSLPKMPTLAKGIGAQAATVTVTQSLHAYATALRAGVSDAKRAACPEISPLPLWADPVHIAKRKAEADAKKKAKAADKAAAEAAAAPIVDAIAAPLAEIVDNSEAVDSEMARDMHADALAAWAKFEAFLSFGVITAAERDAMAQKLALAVTMAEPEQKKTKKGKPSAIVSSAPAALM